MDVRRTVITGMGSILPIGRNLEESFTTIAEVEKNHDLYNFTTTKFGNKPVGLISNDYFYCDIGERERARYDRVSLLVLSVVRQCIESAGLIDQRSELDCIGIISGSCFGCLGSEDSFRCDLYEGGPLMIDPMKFPLTSHNYPVSVSAIKYGLKGPITAIVASMGSSLSALIFANYLVSKGQTRRMIVIGFEEINDLLYAFLNKIEYLSNRHHFKPDKEEVSETLPFEGCTGIVVEDLDSALKREAKIFGEISGWSASYGSYQKIKEYQISRNIKKAIQKAGIDKDNIDLLILNGSGIPNDDNAEALALEKLIDEGVSFNSYLALKPIIGNYLGASGLTEMVFALKMLTDENNINIRKIIQRTFDNKFKFNIGGTVTTFMINNYGLGGNSISFVINAIS